MKRKILVGIVAAMLPLCAAQDHVVSSKELHKALVEAAETRRENIAIVRESLSSDSVGRLLGRLKMHEQMKKAVPFLPNDECHKLANKHRERQ